MKFLFSCLMVAALSACGFSPMYAKGGAGSATEGLDRVEIAAIPDQKGVYLRNILIDQFYQSGYPSSPTHVLEVSQLVEDENDLDITIQSEATRKQIRIRGVMELKDKASGAVVLSRTLTAISSYNVLGSQFTTRVSESDSREAALADMARQIEAQVALYFKR